MSGLATSRRLAKTRRGFWLVALLLALLAGCCVHRGTRECCPICCPVHVRTSICESSFSAQPQPAPTAANAQPGQYAAINSNENDSPVQIPAVSTQSSDVDSPQSTNWNDDEPAKKLKVSSTPVSSRKSLQTEPAATEDDGPGHPAKTLINSALPSNTILLELKAPAAADDPTLQGIELPAEQKVSPLNDLTAGVNSTMELRPADPSLTTTTTARILYAVPKLHPAGLPSLARIIRIEDGVASSDANRPYTLTVVPPADTNTKPIAPVLDLLRTGRQPAADLDQPNIRR